MASAENVSTTDDAVSGEAASYDQQFYQDLSNGSALSASIVVPIIIDLIKPASVVDVGCGTGAWLQEFLRRGIDDLKGIDGEWVTSDTFCLPWTIFEPHHLERRLPCQQRFDLAISLEVAEHLEPSVASVFVDNLVSLSDVVVFSAAIPGQGGTRHLNEQWPTYWAHLFDAHGYQVFDVIRPRIWANKQVEVWYRQNCLLFVNRNAAEMIARLSDCARETNSFLSVVHPELFAASKGMQKREPSFLGTAAQLPDLFIKALGRRLSPR